MLHTLSIIIPTYRRRQDLLRCLDCLAPYLGVTIDSLPFQIEIIVSDDARDTELKSEIESRYPRVRVEDGPQKGPAANRNHGASVANGTWLVFTDDDCLPQPGWLEAFYEKRNEARVLEGKTSSMGPKTRADLECPLNETGGFLWSCNFAITRSLFWDMDGFDQKFPFPAMEDVDLQTRLLKKGESIVFVENALVLHPWRREKGWNFKSKVAQSIAYYATKHPEKKSKYSTYRLAWNFLRYLIKVFLMEALQFKGKGSLRNLANTLYQYISLWRAIHWKNPT